MKKSISIIINLLVYVALFVFTICEYAFFDKQPDNFRIMIMILLAISVEGEEIKSKIGEFAKNK